MQFATATFLAEFVRWNRSHMRFCYSHDFMARIVPEALGYLCTVYTEVGDALWLKLLNRYIGFSINDHAFAFRVLCDPQFRLLRDEKSVCSGTLVTVMCLSVPWHASVVR